MELVFRYSYLCNIKTTTNNINPYMKKPIKSQDVNKMVTQNTTHPDREVTPILDLTKMITREKVAEYLKVSIQTVINYTNRGLLVAHKIGRRVLYNEDEVVAAIQNCTVKRYQHESTQMYIFNKY